MDSFTRIRTLPHVINADLVCHYFDDGDADTAGPVWPQTTFA
jgi:nitrate reductase NapAB chaperone NapD